MLLTDCLAGFLNVSLIILFPSGGDQLEGVAVVFEGDPVWTIGLMRALNANILWCCDDLFYKKKKNYLIRCYCVCIIHQLYEAEL